MTDHLDLNHAPRVLDDFYPANLLVDGRAIKLRITRFDMGQHTDFMRGWSRIGRIAKRDELRIERARQQKTDPFMREPMFTDIPAVDGQPAKRIPVMETDAEVLARLDLDEADDVRDARDKRDADDEDFAREFVTTSISNFIAVEPRQLSTADAAITTGAQLLRYYASREDVLNALLALIYTENVLSEAQKKMLASLHASPAGSTPSTPTASGDAPAPTAIAASNSTSASSADAAALPETKSSGPEAITS